MKSHSVAIAKISPAESVSPVGNESRRTSFELSLVTTMMGFLLVLAAFAVQAFADDVTYNNPFSKYGRVRNASCGRGGICAAAEAENSFIFLSNYYPTVYKNTKITTGGALTQAQAARDFGISGDGFCGYYSRFGAKPCAPNHGVNGTYVDTLSDWLNKYAAGTSYVVSDTNGNQGASLVSGFIGPQLEQHEDVELFIYNLGRTSGHVISPLSITYDPLNLKAGGQMSYQDPNFPNVQQMVDFQINGQGQVQFKDPASGLGLVTVTAGFAESPIPEPSTLALLAPTVLGLSGFLRKQMRKRT